MSDGYVFTPKEMEMQERMGYFMCRMNDRKSAVFWNNLIVKAENEDGELASLISNYLSNGGTLALKKFIFDPDLRLGKLCVKNKKTCFSNRELGNYFDAIDSASIRRKLTESAMEKQDSDLFNRAESKSKEASS